MKTINLTALIIALLVSTGGFEGINLLFTKAACSHERSSVELHMRA